jgi:hypothetical protein
MWYHGGPSYSVEVKGAPAQSAFDWDYGAAWQIVVPLSADADGDGIADSVDNCINHANADQFDADNDGFGNRCDGDFNNNGSTNSQDTTIFRASLASSNPPPTSTTTAP